MLTIVFTSLSSVRFVYNMSFEIGILIKSVNSSNFGFEFLYGGFLYVEHKSSEGFTEFNQPYVLTA